MTTSKIANRIPTQIPCSSFTMKQGLEEKTSRYRPQNFKFQQQYSNIPVSELTDIWNVHGQGGTLFRKLRGSLDPLEYVAHLGTL